MAEIKYIFYDIECANCHNNTAKISSFGYVITNENFDVIEKKEIRINPEAPFFNHIKENGEYIRKEYIPEDINSYLSSPNYSFAYQEIKDILMTPNAYFIGFGNLSDAFYLMEANRRYKKENYSYRFIDIKDIFDYRYKKIRCRGLANMATFFNIPWEQKHISVDDAFMTSKVAERIVKKSQNQSLIQLASKARAFYHVVNDEVFRGSVKQEKHIYPDMKLPD